MLVTLIILQIHETMWFLQVSRFHCLHSLSPRCPNGRGKTSSKDILLLVHLGLLTRANKLFMFFWKGILKPGKPLNC